MKVDYDNVKDTYCSLWAGAITKITHRGQTEKSTKGIKQNTKNKLTFPREGRKRWTKEHKTDGRLKPNHIDNYCQCKQIANTLIKRQKLSDCIKSKKARLSVSISMSTNMYVYETHFISKDTDWSRVKSRKI